MCIDVVACLCLGMTCELMLLLVCLGVTCELMWLLVCLGMTREKADGCADHGAWKDQCLPHALMVN